VIDFGLSGKRAVVSGAGYLPERAGLGWFTSLALAEADFLCGSVVFVDGGSDAYFRADDWPRRAPAYRLLTYLKRFRGYSASA